MKKLYVVLIKAHTGLGSLARKFKGFEYTHVAICFDDSFTDFYTFSRRYHYLPSDCGFMVEKRDFYAFGEHQKFKTKVFELEIDEEHFEKIESFINECRNDSDMMFNAFSMIFWPVEICKSHNCMTFTAKILEISGIISLSLPYYKMRLKDIDRSLSDFVCYEGDMDRVASPEYDAYMCKFGVWTKLAGIIKLFGRLLGRMITGRC